MIVIGEKINATRNSVEKAVAERDAALVSALAASQADAGADVIDVNAGTGGGDPEKARKDMLWLIDIVLKAVSLPLAIDTEIPEVLEAALGAVDGREVWINSVSAETKRMERILPLARESGARLIALCMEGGGIPKDAALRVKAAESLLRAAEKAGIDPARLFFDPLVMPVGADHGSGAVVIETLSLIGREFPAAGTVLGLSNVSFGLPMRGLMNRTFLALCAGAGLDAVIMDPEDDALAMELFAATALLGRDRHCGRYLKEYRKRYGKGGRK